MRTGQRSSCSRRPALAAGATEPQLVIMSPASLQQAVWVFSVALALFLAAHCAEFTIFRPKYSTELGIRKQPPLQTAGTGQSEVVLPVCMDNEFLTFNGTELTCQQLPVRRCRCPGPSTPTVPPNPLPPLGCSRFDAPDRGAFVCLRLPDVIYCSVLCNNDVEFSTTPLNPYLCGSQTGLKWKDFTNVPYLGLPRCTGFRHRQRLLHPEDFYLPAPCAELNETVSSDIRANFFQLVTLFGCPAELCDINDVFIQCPPISAV